MNYTLRLFWNDQMVCDARCTGVVAYDLARSHIAGNFSGERVRTFVDNMGTSLDAVMQLARGETMDRTYGDTTGVARFIIKRWSAQ